MTETTFYPSFRMYFNLLTLVVSTTLFMKREPGGTSLACTGAWAFDNFNIKTWSRDLKRLDEECIERSETCRDCDDSDMAALHKYIHV